MTTKPKLTVGDLRQATAYLPDSQVVVIEVDNANHYVTDVFEDYDPDGFFVLEVGEKL